MRANRPVALITGVGPGTGAAMARRFARGGYSVAMLARSRERMRELEREVEHSRGYACDVTEEAQLDATIERVRSDLGVPKVLIHNAVGGAFGTFLEIEPEVLNRNFQVNTMALLHLARRLAPGMIEAGEGAIVVTGNTSALRGKPKFAGFAPSKAAQRILAEAIAREVSNERARRGALARSGLSPILDQMGNDAAYRPAFAHFDRLRRHPAFVPDVEPYLEKLDRMPS